MTAKRKPKQAPDDAAATRRTVLWVGVVLVAIAVIGFVLVPALRLVWWLLLVFGILAVPQALFRRE